jgi:hypothetical protein
MSLAKSLVNSVKAGKTTFRYGKTGEKTAPISNLTYQENPGYQDFVVGTAVVTSVPKNFDQVNSKGTKYGIANIKVNNLGELNGYITSMMIFETNKDLIEVGQSVEFQISSEMGKTKTGLPAFNVQHHLAGRVAILDEAFDEDFDEGIEAEKALENEIGA